MSGRRARLVVAMKSMHKRCRRNRVEIERAGRFACFYCGGRHPASLVSEWIDRGQTALCPCDCDAALPDPDDAPVSDGELLAMSRYWFGRFGACQVVSRRNMGAT